MDLGLVKEIRRDWMRGADNDGGRRRVRGGGDERKDEDLAEDISVLENEPRHAISDSFCKTVTESPQRKSNCEK